MARRLTSAAEGYDSNWRSIRAVFIAKHPRCGECGKPTQHVDHRIPRSVLVARGVANPDEDRWLQPLCRRCHMVKTAQDRSRA